MTSTTINSTSTATPVQPWAERAGSALGHVPSYAITGTVAAKDALQSFGSGFMAGFRKAEAARKVARE